MFSLSTLLNLGIDQTGIRDAITEILLDLGMDPKSREDRRWAVNKFRKANPNLYSVDTKKSRCKQEYYDYFVTHSVLTASNSVDAERLFHNRYDVGLRQLAQALKMAFRMADFKEIPLDVTIKLYLETVKLKFISGNRKLEIASLALELQERLAASEGDATDGNWRNAANRRRRIEKRETRKY